MKMKYENLMRNWCFIILWLLTILSPVSASWAASISGTIYDTSSPALTLSGVGVQVFTPEGQWLPGLGGCSVQDGDFSIFNIPPGQYILSAGGWSCESPTVYAQTFYTQDETGTYDPRQAFVFGLGSGDVITGRNFHLVVGAIISGNVTVSQGTGPVNVSVNGANWGYGGCTDPSGSYSIRGIPPGTYRISAGGQNWCGGLNYVQVFYNNKPDWNSADLVTLNSGGIFEIDFSGLVLGATVTGKVTDSIGTPLANVQVNVQGSNQGFGGCTDNTGSYTISAIPPGTYRISAGGQSGCTNGKLYRQVFYDNKLDWNLADLIPLSVGQTRTGINFSNLVLDAAISGKISGDPNIGLININVVLHDSLGRLVDFRTVWDYYGGGYYFGGLTPGETYTVKVYDPFLGYQYAERSGLLASLGSLIIADFTLTNYVRSGTNQPTFKSKPMAFVIHRPDGTEILQLSAEVDDPSGCQPASIKSVTAMGPDGTFHYLYHEKYQALVDQQMSYGEFWWTSRDNEFADMSTQVGDFTIEVLDVDGNRTTATANLGSYSKYKLPIPTLINPAPGTQVDPNSLTLSWNPVPNAMAYQVRIMYLGERIWKYETCHWDIIECTT